MRRARFLLAWMLLPALGLALALTWVARAPQTGAQAEITSLGLLSGSNLIGWVGAPTTSTALIDADPAISAIWTWDDPGQQWTGDARALPAALRPTLAIRQGDGFFVIASAATAIDVGPAEPGPGTALPTAPGAHLVGWIGAATTTAVLLDANPEIDAIWTWDAAGQRWLGDARALPAALRPAIAVIEADGLFVIVPLPPPAVTGGIAFASNRDGAGNIYVINADGTGLTRLTTDGGGQPAWSPDGRRLAFASVRERIAEIYVMNADGSGRTRLTTDGGSAPAWSPDGRRIAFVRIDPVSARLSISVMNADGSGQTPVTTPVPNSPAGNDTDPAWSPDGRRIAFVRVDPGPFRPVLSIYVMNADGSRQTRLTESSLLVSQAPLAWSPDGSRIAFGAFTQGMTEIFVMNVDGTGVRQLTANGASSPTWSPDGSRIAFMSGRDGNLEIYVMNADGSGQTRITNNPANDSQPAWSPAP